MNKKLKHLDGLCLDINEFERKYYRPRKHLYAKPPSPDPKAQASKVASAKRRKIWDDIKIGDTIVFTWTGDNPGSRMAYCKLKDSPEQFWFKQDEELVCYNTGMLDKMAGMRILKAKRRAQDTSDMHYRPYPIVNGTTVRCLDSEFSWTVVGFNRQGWWHLERMNEENKLVSKRSRTSELQIPADMQRDIVKPTKCKKPNSIKHVKKAPIPETPKISGRGKRFELKSPPTPISVEQVKKKKDLDDGVVFVEDNENGESVYRVDEFLFFEDSIEMEEACWEKVESTTIDGYKFVAEDEGENEYREPNFEMSMENLMQAHFKAQSKKKKKGILSKKYRGVYYVPTIGMYEAKRKVDGRNLYGGYFMDEKRAAAISDKLYLCGSESPHESDFNFPLSFVTDPSNLEKSSKFEGVFRQSENTWIGVLEHNNKDFQVPGCLSEDEAALWLNVKCKREKRPLVNTKAGTNPKDFFLQKSGLVHSLDAPEDIDHDELPELMDMSCSSEPPSPANLNSLYIGVSWNFDAKKWHSERDIGGEKIDGGLFSSEQFAAENSDFIYINHRMNTATSVEAEKLNFPNNFVKYSRAISKNGSSDRFWKQTRKCRKKSKYIGVNWSRVEQKWRARRRIGNHSYIGGFYADEQMAAKCSDVIYLRHQQPQLVLDHRLNFPLEREMLSKLKLMNPEIVEVNVTSEYIGVIWKKKENCWMVRRVINGQKFFGRVYSKKEESLAGKNSDEVYLRYCSEPRPECLNFINGERNLHGTQPCVDLSEDAFMVESLH